MKRIALSLVDSGNGYQQLLYEDARAAAKRAGVEIEAHFCESDFAKQLEQMGTALGNRPAALLAMAVHDRGLARLVRRAAQEGVHCVFLNETEDPLDEIRQRFPEVAVFTVCADEEESGRMQGRLARALLPEGGRLLLVEGTRRSLTARGRTSGLQEVLEGAGVEVDRLEAGWTVDDGRAAAQRWLKIALQFNRALDVIVCHNDSLAVGVRAALGDVARELARPEVARLPIVGCDGTPELGQAMVAEGALAATVIQPRLGGQAVESLIQVLEGGALPPPVTRVPGTPHQRAGLSPGAGGEGLATTG